MKESEKGEVGGEAEGCRGSGFEGCIIIWRGQERALRFNKNRTRIA